MDLFSTFTTVVHVGACIFLIIVVLLQSGKGAEIGAVLGGAGSQTLFGGSGGGTFLSKVTAWMAVVFMVSSLSLTAFAGRDRTTSVMEGIAAPTAPAVEAPAAGADDAPGLDADVDAAPVPAESAPEGEQ